MSDGSDQDRDMDLAMWLLLGMNPNDIPKIDINQLILPALRRPAGGRIVITPDGRTLLDYEPNYPLGADEKKAREAVARLLLNDYMGDVGARVYHEVLCRVLAELFGSNGRGKKIVLEHRREGAPELTDRNEVIYAEVQSMSQTMSNNRAYEMVAKKRGLTAATVKRICLNWRRQNGCKNSQVSSPGAKTI
jgi:hypothetical protein